jgi:hypothetical protein
MNGYSVTVMTAGQIGIDRNDPTPLISSVGAWVEECNTGGLVLAGHGHAMAAH